MNAVIIFIALHLFIYPASNSYNSYMDEDKGSIGGLKNPPPVNRKIYYISILFDCTGLLICLFINWNIFFMMMVYIGISKAYSWKKTRLKKHGYAGWLVVMLFQGGYTFLMVNMSVENIFDLSWFSHKNIECMTLASLLIGGFYPLTQIYQHEEDNSRGDKTISLKLGITGTFIFSALLFLLSCPVAWHYFTGYYSAQHFLIFILCLVPVMAYYFYWFKKTMSNKNFADYRHSMQMTFLSSSSMIICFGILLFLNHIR